jgi:hypothetical protein
MGRVTPVIKRTSRRCQRRTRDLSTGTNPVSAVPPTKKLSQQILTQRNAKIGDQAPAEHLSRPPSRQLSLHSRKPKHPSAARLGPGGGGAAHGTAPTDSHCLPPGARTPVIGAIAIVALGFLFRFRWWREEGRGFLAAVGVMRGIRIEAFEPARSQGMNGLMLEL